MPLFCDAVIIVAAEPEIVVTAVASTATLVIVATVFRSAASADGFVTVIVSALLPFASVSVVSVARSPSVISAVIAPVVADSIAFSSVTDAVPVKVTSTSGSCVVAAVKPTLSTPKGARSAAASLIPPVNTMFALVWALIVLKSAMDIGSETVTLVAPEIKVKSTPNSSRIFGAVSLIE